MIRISFLTEALYKRAVGLPAQALVSPSVYGHHLTITELFNRFMGVARYNSRN